NVAPGGTISTIVPTFIQSLLSSTTVHQQINLSLTALGNIINAGSITSSGTLSLRAGGSIINQLPTGAAAGMPSPVLAGITGVNLYAGSGNIVNNGVIQSALGSINLTGAATKDLIVNNIQGQILANL